ncbi:MAG: hypothetical protein ACRDS0_22705 [Pseudonocardiaceae bacterium]
MTAGRLSLIDSTEGRLPQESAIIIGRPAATGCADLRSPWLLVTSGGWMTSPRGEFR